MGDKEPNNDKKELVTIEQQSYFFDDLIIEEIFTRLPIKSILRFKSVSKQWYSTLSSSDFTKAHLIKSPSSHPSVPVDTLFIKCGKNFYLSSCDDDQILDNFQDNLVKLDIDFGVEEELIRLTGCCNGLVCLTLIRDGHFIIWNPATRKVHKYESDVYLNRVPSSHWPTVVHGFGYVSSVDDYKYVRILIRRWGNEKGNIIHIFSLKEKKWRNFFFNHDMFISSSGAGALLVNEKLYMIADTRTDYNRIVVSFDLELEKFEILFKLDRFDYLGIMGGCLSISNTISDNWIMYKHESHTKIKIVCLPRDLRLDASSKIIGFTRAGKFFVTASGSDIYTYGKNGKLGFIDTDTKGMQYMKILIKVDEEISIARYVPSLVLPF